MDSWDPEIGYNNALLKRGLKYNVIYIYIYIYILRIKEYEDLKYLIISYTLSPT